MKKIRIFETLNSVLDMQITESQDNLMHLEGIFGVCGVLNNNHRIYTKENYAKMIEQLQDKIEKKALLGEMEHSMSLTTKLDNVSHRIDSVSIDEDGVVHGSLTILKTPKGQIAEAIIRSGSPLYVSSKAVGSIDKNNVVTLTRIFGWDLVGSPGFSEAEVNLKESIKLESMNDNILIMKEADDQYDIKENGLEHKNEDKNEQEDSNNDADKEDKKDDDNKDKQDDNKDDNNDADKVNKDDSNDANKDDKQDDDNNSSNDANKDDNKEDDDKDKQDESVKEQKNDDDIDTSKLIDNDTLNAILKEIDKW